MWISFFSPFFFSKNKLFIQERFFLLIFWFVKNSCFNGFDAYRSASDNQDYDYVSPKLAKNLTTFTGQSVGEYEIRNWTLSTGQVTKDGAIGLKVHLELGRNLVSIIMVTYLPTILINIINQATNYVLTGENYDLIVTVNITSMMVLASIYLSVSNSLPTTANIKPVEIWLLFNISYPFIVIIINIILKVNRVNFSLY